MEMLAGRIFPGLMDSPMFNAIVAAHAAARKLITKPSMNFSLPERVLIIVHRLRFLLWTEHCRYCQEQAHHQALQERRVRPGLQSVPQQKHQ